MKRKLKFEDYKNRLEATLLENKIIVLNYNKFDIKAQNLTTNMKITLK